VQEKTSATVRLVLITTRTGMKVLHTLHQHHREMQNTWQITVIQSSN